MTSKAKILIIDDEQQIRRLLKITLESNNYTVVEAVNGDEGRRRATTERPDALILDLGLPDIDGMAVLSSIREWSAMPVLILSVRNNEEDIVRCLDAGADDYLTKPFRTGELLARLRSVLRHKQPHPEEPVVTVGNVAVDFGSRVVKKDGEQVKLTQTEFSLLTLFLRFAGRVLTHKFILEQVWGPSFAEETQYTRVYVGQLRKKLETDPSHPRLFLTESGIGYRLAMEQEVGET